MKATLALASPCWAHVGIGLQKPLTARTRDRLADRGIPHPCWSGRWSWSRGVVGRFVGRLASLSALVLVVGACLMLSAERSVRAAVRPSGRPPTETSAARSRQPRPDNSVFLSVSCGATRRCQAVGAGPGSDTYAPVATGWDGARWSLEPVPNLAPRSPSLSVDGTIGGELESVSCASRSACTAVGYEDVIIQGGSDIEPALAERWDGRSWSIVSVTPAEESPHDLVWPRPEAVSCPSQTTCIVVGQTIREVAMAATIGAGGWSPQSISLPAGISELTGVSCVSMHDCLAVGTTAPDMFTNSSELIEHWDGAAWQRIPASAPQGADDVQPSGISCTTRACVVVGTYTTACNDPDQRCQQHALIQRDTNNRWSRQWTKAPIGFVLTAVSCTSVRFCMAVGDLPMRWNGRSWLPTTLANPQDVGAGGVSCVSPKDCTMVSGRGSPRPYAEHWDGKSWHTQIIHG